MGLEERTGTTTMAGATGSGELEMLRREVETLRRDVDKAVAAVTTAEWRASAMATKTLRRADAARKLNAAHNRALRRLRTKGEDCTRLRGMLLLFVTATIVPGVAAAVTDEVLLEVRRLKHPLIGDSERCNGCLLPATDNVHRGA